MTPKPRNTAPKPITRFLSKIERRYLLKNESKKLIKR